MNHLKVICRHYDILLKYFSMNLLSYMDIVQCNYNTFITTKKGNDNYLIAFLM